MNETSGIVAGSLSECLIATHWKRRKSSFPINLHFNPASSQLKVSEARYRKFEYSLSATGKKAWKCQLDGVRLAKIVSKFVENQEIQLNLVGDALALTISTTSILIPVKKAGDGGYVVPKILPFDSRHKGRPEGIDRPMGPTVDQRQTWLFSTRIPWRDK